MASKARSGGVRKGPPYPLEYDEHTNLEKKYNRKEELQKYTNSLQTEKHGVGASKYLADQYEEISKGVRADYKAKAADLNASKDAEIKKLKAQKDSLTRDQYQQKLQDIESKYKTRAVALMQENTTLSNEVIDSLNSKIIENYGYKSFNDLNNYMSYKKVAPAVIALVNAANGYYEY